MKKIFKALSLMVASTAVCAGIAMASGCAQSNGTYVGSYSYTNSYNATYGMVVEVTVKNNIITKVRDITNTESAKSSKQGGKDWTVVSSAMPDYGWDQSSVNNWTDNEAWLLQQYEGKSVADVRGIRVFTRYGYTNGVVDNNVPGEPYSTDRNDQLLTSGLLITNSTQGSGRLLLAVQDALKK